MVSAHHLISMWSWATYFSPLGLNYLISILLIIYLNTDNNAWPLSVIFRMKHSSWKQVFPGEWGRRLYPSPGSWLMGYAIALGCFCVHPLEEGFQHLVTHLYNFLYAWIPSTLLLFVSYFLFKSALDFFFFFYWNPYFWKHVATLNIKIKIMNKKLLNSSRIILSLQDWIWDLPFLAKRELSINGIAASPWDFLLNNIRSKREMKKAGLSWHMVVTDIESWLMQFPFLIPVFLAAWLCFISCKSKNKTS